MDTSHSGIIMVKYISCNGRSLGFKVYFFSFFQNIYLKHASSVFYKYRIITAATIVVPFCFQGQLRGGFTFTKFFLSVTSLKALIQRCSSMKYGTSIGFSFEIAVLNIFGKFLEKHQRQSSQSA